MTASDDVIRIAQRYADEILRDAVTPYDGGHRIWKECQFLLERGDRRLDPFVYWASEYEDTRSKKRRALCDRALRKAADLLVQTGSAL